MKKISILSLIVFIVFILVGCNLNPAKQNFSEEEATQQFIDYSKQYEEFREIDLLDFQKAVRFNNLNYQDVFIMQFSYNPKNFVSWDAKQEVEYFEGFYFTKDKEINTFVDLSFVESRLYSNKFIMPQTWYSDEFDIYINLDSISLMDNNYILSYSISELDLNNIIESGQLELTQRDLYTLSFDEPQQSAQVNMGNRGVRFDMFDEMIKLSGHFQFQTQPEYETFLNEMIVCKPILNNDNWLTVEMKSDIDTAKEVLLEYYLPYEVSEFENGDD